MAIVQPEGLSVKNFNDTIEPTTFRVVVQYLKHLRYRETTNPHLKPKLKKEYSYTFSSPLDFHGLL
jgi:hypothetical protein